MPLARISKKKQKHCKLVQGTGRSDSEGSEDEESQIKEEAFSYFPLVGRPPLLTFQCSDLAKQKGITAN